MSAEEELQKDAPRLRREPEGVRRSEVAVFAVAVLLAALLGLFVFIGAASIW